MIPGLAVLQPYLIWIKLGAAALVIGVSFGGGWTVATWRCDAGKSAQLTAGITIERTLREKVPVIITKVVEKEVKVAEEEKHAIEIIYHDVSSDCVLPDEFGGMLVDRARGLDGIAPRGPDEARGAYDCRQVLEAVTKDLAAGKRTGERLTGLQDYERLKAATK